MIRKYDIAGDRKKESPRILLRRRVRELLGSGDPEQVIRELGKIPPRKAISPLISVFLVIPNSDRRQSVSSEG